VRWAVAASAVSWWASLALPWAFALGWVALAPLLWAADTYSRALQGSDLDGREAQRAFLLWSWKCGAVCFALINWWIAPTIGQGAPSIGLPSALGWVLGAISVVLISFIHAAQVALSLLAWRALRASSKTQGLASALGFALAWTLCDWARSQTILAHSWGALAFSQWRDLWSLQSAAWIGQHGLTFLCALCCALAALAACEAAVKGQNRPLPVLPLAALAGVLLLWHGAGWWRLSRAPVNPRATLDVMLVQTNVPSSRKLLGGGETSVSQALRLSENAVRQSVGTPLDLVVWPETTANLQLEATSSEKMLGLDSVVLQSAVERWRAPLLTGARVMQSQPSGEQRLWNDATLFQAGIYSTDEKATLRANSEISRLQAELARSSKAEDRDLSRLSQLGFVEQLVAAPVERRGKTRLVPFGERAPFSQWLPWLGAFAPRPPVEPAPLQGPIELKRGGRSRLALATLICFESCFSWPATSKAAGARALAARSADAAGREALPLMVVITNDEWFRGTEAPLQHAAMGVVRAVESDLPLVQAANGGRSFAVDRFGRFVLERAVPSPGQPEGQGALIERSWLPSPDSLVPFGEALVLVRRVPVF
jgi:apolipoprotein N-acyltransferase